MGKKGIIEGKNEFYLVVLILTLIGGGLYYRVFTIPPDSEIIFYVEYPLTAGNFSSFVHWLLSDNVRLTGVLRQVPMFIQGGVFLISHGNYFILHLLSFVVFVLVGLFIFIILKKEGIRFGYAVLGSVIFMIHPVNAINLTKIIHFMGLFGFLLFLIALNLYLSYRDKRKSWGIYALEGSLITLMLFSYELFIVAPLLLILYEFFIKARGNLQNANVFKVLASFTLWMTIIVIYLIVRWMIFHGIGDYKPIGKLDLTAPFLKGMKWLSGVGFLHFSQRPIGWLDFISFLALVLILFLVFLRKANLYLFLAAFLWFAAGIFPFFKITPSYHYVFAFPLIGLSIIAALALNELRLKSLKLMTRVLFLTAAATIMLIWVYETRLGINDVENLIKRQIAVTQGIYDRIENKQAPVEIFLVTEEYDQRPFLRLALWLYPIKVDVEKIVLSKANANINDFIAKEQVNYLNKVYVWQRRKECLVYPSREVLFQEAGILEEAVKVNNGVIIPR